MAEQVGCDRADGKHVSLVGACVDQHEASVVSRHDEGVRLAIEVRHFLQAPAPNTKLVRQGMGHNPDDFLKAMVNENVLVVIPRSGKVLIRVILNDLIHELFSLVAELIDFQA